MVNIPRFIELLLAPADDNDNDNKAKRRRVEEAMGSLGFPAHMLVEYIGDNHDMMRAVYAAAEGLCGPFANNLRRLVVKLGKIIVVEPALAADDTPKALIERTKYLLGDDWHTKRLRCRSTHDLTLRDVKTGEVDDDQMAVMRHMALYGQPTGLCSYCRTRAAFMNALAATDPAMSMCNRTALAILEARLHTSAGLFREFKTVAEATDDDIAALTPKQCVVFARVLGIPGSGFPWMKALAPVVEKTLAKYLELCAPATMLSSTDGRLAYFERLKRARVVESSDEQQPLRKRQRTDGK